MEDTVLELLRVYEEANKKMIEAAYLLEAVVIDTDILFDVLHDIETQDLTAEEALEEIKGSIAC